jgi:hypothetical protein
MGYALVISPCFGCNRTFSYHPSYVPAIRIKGIKQPVCQSCMDAANAKRKEMGMEPHPIHRRAYDVAEEHEI